MKFLYSFFTILFFCHCALSQNQDNLITAIDGDVALLWKTVDDNYHYFIKKGGELTELKNTQTGRKYNAEYKEQLQKLIGVSNDKTRKLRFTLADLKQLVIAYNIETNPNYQDTSNKFEYRLGIHAGVNNGIFYSENPQNILQKQLLIDFEVYNTTTLPSHGLTVQTRHVFAQADYDYRHTQFAINYRYKFIHSKNIEAYINTKVATYTYSSGDALISETEGSTIILDNSGGNLTAPLALGIGVYKAIGHGYLSLNFFDIVSLTQRDNGNFPVDLTLGYIINL